MYMHMHKEKSKCSILIENSAGEVLMQLRDNKPHLKFPNCLSTFGGAIEKGETPRNAIIREVREELGYDLKDFIHWKTVTYDGYDIYVFYTIDENFRLEDFKIMEGQKGVWVSKENIDTLPYEFGFDFKKLLIDYFQKLHR